MDHNVVLLFPVLSVGGMGVVFGASLGVCESKLFAG